MANAMALVAFDLGAQRGPNVKLDLLQMQMCLTKTLPDAPYRRNIRYSPSCRGPQPTAQGVAGHRSKAGDDEAAERV